MRLENLDSFLHCVYPDFITPTAGAASSDLLDVVCADFPSTITLIKRTPWVTGFRLKEVGSGHDRRVSPVTAFHSGRRSQNVIHRFLTHDAFQKEDRPLERNEP